MWADVIDGRDISLFKMFSQLFLANETGNITSIALKLSPNGRRNDLIFHVAFNADTPSATTTTGLRLNLFTESVVDP